jgi:hypothetical protein
MDEGAGGGACEALTRDGNPAQREDSDHTSAVGPGGQAIEYHFLLEHVSRAHRSHKNRDVEIAE